MKFSLSVGMLVLCLPIISLASVTVVWNPSNATAAAAWLETIEASQSREDPDTFYYFSTTKTHPFSDPIIANLTVWDDHAALNTFGVGHTPTGLRLWGEFLELGSILEIEHHELLSGEGEAYYTYSSVFAVEPGFARIVFNSAAMDGLALLADSVTGTSEVYALHLTTIPEPNSLALFALGTAPLFRRQRSKNTSV